MARWVKFGEKKWIKAPDGTPLEEIISFIENRTDVKAAARLAGIKAGEDIPEGVDLETPEDAGFLERTGRIVLENAEKFNENVFSVPLDAANALTGLSEIATSPIRAGVSKNQGDEAGYIDRVKRLAGEGLGKVGSNLQKVGHVVQSPLNVATSPLQAGGEKLIRGVTGAAGPEAEEIARGGAQFGTYVAQAIAPMAAAGIFRARPAAAAAEAAPAEKLVLDRATKDIVKVNEPAPPMSEIALRDSFKVRGVDPDDPLQVIQAKLRDAGIKGADVKVKVGAPVSKTTFNADGSVSVELADGRASQALHESEHIISKLTGKAHPVEDNAKIVADELNDLVGKEIEIPGRGPGRVKSYNEKYDSYEVKLKSGVKQDIPADDLEKYAAATEPGAIDIVEAAAKSEAESPLLIDPENPQRAARFAETGSRPEAVGPVAEALKKSKPAEGQFFGEASPPKKLPKVSGVTKATGARVLSGRTTGSNSAEARNAKIADEADGEASRSFLLSLANFRKAFVTTTLRNPARNVRQGFWKSLGEATARASGSVMQKAILRGRRAFGLSQPEVELIDGKIGWAYAKNLFDPRRAKKLVSTFDRLEAAQPGVFKRLSDSFMSGDLDPKIFDALPPNVREVVKVGWNLNMKQEMWYRRAIAAAEMDSRLAARGTSLDDILNSGDFSQLTDDIVKPAITKAREITMALEPERGTLAYNAIKMIRDNGAASNLVLFPRMAYNNIRSIYQYSPAGIIDAAKIGGFLSGKPEAVMAVTKSVIGTGMFAAAAQIVKGRMNSLKSYDFLPGEGIALGPENPFSIYPIAGAIYQRVVNEDPSKELKLDMAAISDAVLALGSRTMGTGDSIERTMRGLLERYKDSNMTAGRFVTTTAGELLGAFTVPASTLKNLSTLIDEEEAYQRDTEANPLLGPAVANVPFLDKMLPKRTSVYQGEEVKNPTPWLSELTGYRLVKKTPIQNELEKYQIKIDEYPFDVPEQNQEFQKLAAERLVDSIGNVVISDQYKNSPQSKQIAQLKAAVSAARSYAMKAVVSKLPREEQMDLKRKTWTFSKRMAEEEQHRGAATAP